MLNKFKEKTKKKQVKSKKKPFELWKSKQINLCTFFFFCKLLYIKQI